MLTRVTYFGPGSDPTDKRPTRDPTRPDSMQMQCVTLDYIFTIKK